MFCFNLCLHHHMECSPVSLVFTWCLLSVSVSKCPFYCKDSTHTNPVKPHLNLISSCSVSTLSLTLCDRMGYSTLGFPVLHHLPEFAHTHVHWVGDAILSSHPMSSPSPPPLNFPSNGVFSNESVLHTRWTKYWSFSFSISPSNEYSMISFRMDWLDLLAVQGTLKSLLQYHSSKASILQRSAFFIVQLSHLT